MSLFDAPHFPPVTSEDERVARLRLARTQRIGPINFQQLITRFGSAIRALEALPSLAQRAGGGITPAPMAMVEAEIAQSRAAGARLVVLGDTDYPKLLSHIAAAPPVLWLLGDHALPPKAVSIVGARNASAAGMKMAHQLAADLGEAGYLIVSGLARGIDTHAHQGSLKTGTAAVLGGGIDDVYPPQNQDLYTALKSYGVLISENPAGYRAHARDFPRRNRVISGLTLGTIVVEAELRSGSLITARLAGEQNRDVFAVPGSPLDPRARGSNDLLRQGAHLCETADDVIRILETQMGLNDGARARFDDHRPHFLTLATFDDIAPEAIDDRIDDLRTQILNLISHTPSHRDEVLRLAGASMTLGFAALSELEIAGLIAPQPGGYYVLSN
ncbi:MAG: DNA protecting protein DprA [Asticcacaulis sp. 32-58-5]|nr:MAG: DNA protecting protein DprA [Asticcacaulis sp. 32-58-5]